MSKMIKHEDFVNSMMALLDECFDQTHGIFLDKDTSLFRTLETITAGQASIPVGGRCASLAAQVAHVTYYLEVLLRYVVEHDTGQVDWGYIWRTVEKVTDEEWETLKSNLRDRYQSISSLFRDNPEWDEDSIGGCMAIIAHSAYHLGEIRQALCILQPDR
jgi:hypothetical protein